MKFETKFEKAHPVWKHFELRHPIFEEKIDKLIQLYSGVAFEHNLLDQLRIAYFSSFDMDLFHYNLTKFLINI